MIAAQAKQLLQVNGIDAGFASRKPPHRFEPIGDRFFRSMHNGTGGQGNLMFTSFADVDIVGTELIGVMTTFFTSISIGQLDLG